MSLAKHREIIAYLRTVDTATLSDIYSNVSFGYYANWEKHLGAIMPTLVRQGKVVRVKKGVFSLNKGQFPLATQAATNPPNQPSLF